MAESDREGQRVRLGVFVVSGILALVGGVLVLTAGRLFERTLPVHVYFQETVQGLAIGSEIKYRGVAVGRVTRIALRTPAGGQPMTRDATAMIEVEGEMFPDVLSGENGPEMSFDEVRDFVEREVDRGLRVRLQWKDITGQKFLDVDYLAPEQYPPPDLGFEPDEIYIPTAMSASLQDIQQDLARTLSQLSKIRYEEIGNKIVDLLDVLYRTMGDIQGGALTQSIMDAANAVRDIANDPQLQEAIGRLDGITASLERLAERTDRLLAKPEVEQGIDDLAATAGSLRRSAEELEQTIPDLTRDLQTALDSVRTTIEESRIPETTAAVREGALGLSSTSRHVGVIREELRVSLRQVGEAARAISRLASYLERNPDALLQGRRVRGGEDD